MFYFDVAVWIYIPKLSLADQVETDTKTELYVINYTDCKDAQCV